VRLNELERLDGGEVTLASLRAAGIVPRGALGVKIILSGKLTKKLAVKGDVKATKGARAAIESAGGSVEVVEKVEKREAKSPAEGPKA
jgi:large subunit ribosomal protein L15